MLEEKLITSSRSALQRDNGLHHDGAQSEYEAPQIKIFMDYCYFIEKLWLDWKHYYLSFLD